MGAALGEMRTQGVQLSMPWDEEGRSKLKIIKKDHAWAINLLVNR